MKRALRFAALAIALAAPEAARAYSTGITEGIVTSQGSGGAVSGCICHSSPFVPPNTPTRVFLTGLPEEYAPETPYSLRVFVLGVSIPVSTTAINLPTAEALAGFSLFASDGEFHPMDGHVRVRNETECSLMERQHALQPVTPTCLGPGGTCGVRTDGGYARCGSYDPSIPWCRPCDPDTGNCRACDSERILSTEATHTRNESGLSIDPILDDVTIPRTDGNNRFFWDVEWMSPPAGSGTVRFNVAGNVANGNNVQDFGDIWNFGERVYLCEAGSDCESGSGGGHEH